MVVVICVVVVVVSSGVAWVTVVDSVMVGSGVVVSVLVVVTAVVVTERGKLNQTRVIMYYDVDVFVVSTAFGSFVVTYWQKSWEAIEFPVQIPIACFYKTELKFQS